MLFFYNLGIQVYRIILFLLSPFNEKARLWVSGRRNLISHIRSVVQLRPGERTIWFHFPSLGEFEQGRPVLEQVRQLYPEKKLIITFFSPSGYVIRKNYPLADHVFYLPEDTALNATQFISLIRPELVVFTKYDYWYYYFRELHRLRVTLYIISAIFNPKQSFFQWYGGFQRKMLSYTTQIFVQDDESQTLLRTIGIGQVTVSGDTRFDRVAMHAETRRELPPVKSFSGDARVLVAGSTWQQDEELLAQLADVLPGWKFIIAPHEIGVKRIAGAMETFRRFTPVKYSDFVQSGIAADDSRLLLIDNIGMLSSLYHYGSAAYIGGGFGAGIHNTLEAAAFNLPVIFGPNYQRFREARELISCGGGFSIRTAEELKEVATALKDDQTRHTSGDQAGRYVRGHTGATEIIIEQVIIALAAADTRR